MINIEPPCPPSVLCVTLQALPVHCLPTDRCLFALSSRQSNLLPLSDGRCCSCGCAADNWTQQRVPRPRGQVRASRARPLRLPANYMAISSAHMQGMIHSGGGTAPLLARHAARLCSQIGARVDSRSKWQTHFLPHSFHASCVTEWPEVSSILAAGHMLTLYSNSLSDRYRSTPLLACHRKPLMCIPQALCFH